MHLIVTSAEDIASMNIREKILDMAPWKETGLFDGSPVLSNGQYQMVLIQDIHLYWDNLDTAVMDATGMNYDTVIFASRHRSKSGLRTLTVHPLGNYGPADFGGKPETIVPPNPRLMTAALLLLQEKAGDLDFEISFEVTHHGPYLETPTFFIEIGSNEAAWPEPEPARRIASVLLELPESKTTHEDDIVLGVGGGHYAPRHTDFINRNKASMSHMVPNYALKHLNDDMVSQLKKKTGAEKVYFHKKYANAETRKRVGELLASHGFEAVRSRDMRPRD